MQHPVADRLPISNLEAELIQRLRMRRRPVLLAPTGADGRTPAARESCGLATPSPQGMLP